MKTLAAVLLMACVPAYGAYAASSITVYGDAVQGESWTELDFWEYYGWEGFGAYGEAELTRNGSRLDFKTAGGVGWGFASVNLFGSVTEGDAEYQVTGWHYRWGPWPFGEGGGYYWQFLGNSNAEFIYDDPNDPPPMPQISGLNPNHGVANVTNYIEIYGSNFTPPQGGTQVTLGGQAVTMTGSVSV